MISSNTIEVSNVIELGTAYLTRFFSKAGQIEKITKNNDKQKVLIEFKRFQSIDKVMKFNGRILDKKPIDIKHIQITKQDQQQQLSEKNNEKNNEKNKEKNQYQNKEKIVLSIPYLSQFKDIPYKLQIQSAYRLIIDDSDIEDNEIHFISNPLQGMKNKSYLWKALLHQLIKNIKSFDFSSKQLILSVSMCIWALIQLKLKQIQHLLSHNQNKKTKYIENFIQEIVINKLALLNNNKIINNSHRYKAVRDDYTIQLNFNVQYPQESQEQSKHQCKTNEKAYNFLRTLYSHSLIFGKIYHQLHANSLILFQQKSNIFNLLNIFQDNSSVQKQQNFQSFVIQSSQILNQSQPSCIKRIYQKQKNLSNQSWMIFQKQLSKNQFTGWLQNYGSYIFHNLSPFKIFNSSIWIQINNNKIDKKYPYPGFFYTSLLYKGFNEKVIQQKNYLNLYDYQIKSQVLNRKQSIKLIQSAIVYELGQFSLKQINDLTLNYLKFNLRKMHYRNFSASKQQDQNEEKINSNLRSVISIHSQQKKSNQFEFKSDSGLTIKASIILVGSQFKQNCLRIIRTFKLLEIQVKRLCQQYKLAFNCQVEIQLGYNFFQIISGKQQEFNRHRCEIYLIEYIDKNVIGKNSIIASEQVAEKLGEKILQQIHGHKLFGIGDKKLYQKSGARRAKQKIEEYSNFRRVKMD